MPLPEVNFVIQDPGLGVIPPSAGRRQVKMGVCQKLLPNTIAQLGSVNAAREALGAGGPVLEALAQVLASGGGDAMAVSVLPSTYGTVTGGFSLVGSGTGTVVGSKGPEKTVAIKIILGGALGTATFQVSIGGGAYGPTVTTVNSPPWSYMIPGQNFTTAVFAAGTYVANDVYTINLDGTVTRVGSGTASLLDGSTHSPVDGYDIWVKIATAGGLGVGAFQYSLDGGNQYSGTIAIPAGGKYVIPGTGVVLTFAGTFTKDDTYKGTATHATYSTSDVTNAFVALRANPTEFGLVHVVGTTANAAGAASLFATVATQMTTMEGEFRWARSYIECPETEGDSTIKTAFAALVDPRVGVLVAPEGLTSPLTGRTNKRNGWAYMARLSSKAKLSTHPGQVSTQNGGGALKNVRSIYRDESATPGLDEARFVTNRTIVGQPGYFATRGRLMAAPGSDVSQIMNAQVLDRACVVGRAGVVLFLNKDVRVADTGYIDERDAQEIDANVTMKLRPALLDEDEVSDISFTLSRTDNILSTSTLNGEIAIRPKGYAETIRVTIGFVNPLAAAAAA